MKNCLIVNGVEYSFEEIENHVLENFDSGYDEYYGRTNALTFHFFTNIVNSLKKNDPSHLKDLWKNEVANDETDKSFDDWVEEYNG